jgi:sigma-B regulation protein RsbU (phosphoserine phosphatase)
VGLIEGASWEDFTVQLFPGDRIMLMSDGITECPGAKGDMLEEEGLVKIMRRNARLHGESFFETLIWDLTTYAGDKDFPDDVSAVLLQFDGTP